MADDPDTLTGDEVIPPKLSSNPGFVGDQPHLYEPPEDARYRSAMETPPPLGQEFGALVQASSPLAWLGRAVERGTQQGSSAFDRGLVTAGHAAQSALDVEAGIVPNAQAEPVQSKVLSAAEANERFSPEGTKIFDGPTPEGLARIIGKQKADELQRNSVIARGAETHYWPTNFGLGMAAFMMDPLNLATNIVPIFGEATIGAAVGRIGMTGIVARTATRGLAGAATMTAQQVPLSLAELALGREEASDFGMREALTQVFYGAVGGAAFHAGIFGGLRELGVMRPDHLMRPPEPPPLPGATRPGGPPPLPDSTLLGPHADALAAEGEARGPVNLAEHGFTPTDIAALHADGLADADGTMSPEQVAAWREEREVRGAPEVEPVTEPAPHAADAHTVALPAGAHADAMKVAVAEVLDERPVDVTPIIEQARPQAGAGFTTAKGSTYEIHEDGTTTRNKSYHPEHGTADQGAQPRSEATFYVTPEQANVLGEIQTTGPRRMIVRMADGRVGIGYLEGPSAGAIERRTVIQPQTVPASGLIPVELWNKGERVHFGNPITELREATPKATPAEVAAKQQDLQRNGHAAGIPDAELKATTEAIYKPPEEPEKPTEAAKPKAEEGAGKTPRVIPKAEAPKPAEPDRERTTAPKPVFEGVAMEPAQLQKSITFNHDRAAASDRAAKNARTATARAGLRDEAANYRAYARARQSVLDRWKEANPDEAARIFGDQDIPTPEAPAPKPGGMALVETTHSRDGHPLFVVTIGEHVPRARYNALLASAKEGGGHYSTWKGPGGVPGFQFRTREAAETFLRKERGEPAEAPPRPQAAAPEARWGIPKQLWDFIQTATKELAPAEYIADSKLTERTAIILPDGKLREIQYPEEPRGGEPVGSHMFMADMMGQKNPPYVEITGWSNTEIGARASQPITNSQRRTLGRLRFELTRTTGNPNAFHLSESAGTSEAVPAAPAPVSHETPTRPATYGANNKLVTTADAEAIRARMRAKRDQLRTGIDPELMLDGARLAVYHIEAGTRLFADYAREMAADLGHEFRPYLRSWYESARHWPGVDATGLSTPAEIDAHLASLGPHETPGELSHAEADRLLDAYSRPEMDRIAQDIADGHTPEQIADTSGLTVAEVRGLADALERRGEIPEPTAEREAETEADDGLQGPVPVRDEGAGAADVQPTAPVGGDGRPPASEGGGGDGTPPATPRPAAEEQIRGAQPGGRAGGGGARPRDPDRVPGAGGSQPTGTAGRPAPDALVRGENHVIEPGSLAETRGRIAKARGNLEAIELAKQLITEDRIATKAEQDILARYVGWGGLKGAFDVDGRFGSGLETIGGRLKQLLSEDEYRTAARSTQYAHYTSETLVRAMWDAVRGMGFKEGNIFEPGMGIGHFLGMMPADLAAKARYQGIEMDKLTASIAKLLYPKSGVRNADFIRTAIPADHFDLAIGNPPFSDVVVQADPKYAARGFMLHDYFFAKSMDSVRPGGILGFVTSAGTMNKLDTAARDYLAERAEFLGGVRLPNNAFEQSAGTKVTTDVLFFRRLDAGETAERNPGWAETVQRSLPGKDGTPVQANVSRYFSEHPEQVLGREGMTDETVAGVRYAVDPIVGADFETQLREAMDRLPKDVLTEPQTPEARAVLDFASGQKKDGSFYLRDDGALMQYYAGAGREVPRRGPGVKGGFTIAEVERIHHLVPMRDALREVFAADLAKDDAAGATARAALNEHYDRFVEKFGPVNKAEYTYRRPTLVQQEAERLEAREEARSIGDRFDDGDFDPEPYLTANATMTEIARAREQVRKQFQATGRRFSEGEFDPADMPDVTFEKLPNIKAFMGDPESYRLRSIERYEPATGAASKRAIFERNIMADVTEPEIRSANDGVLWSLNQHGRLDLDAIAAKMGRERGAIVGELGDSIYKVPGTFDTYQTKDEYLSGDVVSKLEQARTAAEHDPEVRRNVQALEAAVPAPLPPSDISMVLGMPWVPREIYADFAENHLELGPSRIVHNPGIGSWHAETGDNPAWGTPDRNASDLLSDAMNRTPPRIYEPPDHDGRRAFDPVATQAAQDKVDAMKAAFTDWVAADPERADGLAGLYNDALNRTVLRQYDGSYLTTPGVAADWAWRPHQTRVVARIVQSGNTYMAHAVGAGKTSAMIGAGMEMRRLGLARKPMYVVPNHMLGQFTKEFYEQYPTARIAVADEERFHTSRRKQFVANVAQDDLDAIIITHSSFGKIPISEEYQAHIIQEQLDMLDEALAGLDEQGDRHTVRRIENMKEKLEQKLSAQTSAAQDQTLTFEQMGVDFAFVDEAHLFRKLAFGTKQGNLKGISPEGSGMAWDLYAKMRYLDDQKPGQSHVFASGTPITNTMGELYSLSRFMQPEALKARGIAHFDSWAQTFGDTKTQLEENAAGGYQPVTRFNQFVNMPELYKMVGEIMDIVTPSQLEQYVTRPKLAGGARKLHMAPRTEILDEYQAHLASRMEDIKARRGPPKKGDDILLSVINDGRHAAIDPRFVAQAQNDPNSKLNIMLANVAKIWRETADHEFFNPADGYQTSLGRGPAAQMIFANLGVNGRGPMGFSTYQWIKEALRREGVPPEQIAFIGDYSGSVQRQALFNDVNQGKVRILVGSTQKMGTGVNAQKRLAAIHNLDPLWFPADDEQRVGRGLRQGNTNKELQVHDYTTKGTYDSAMWGMMGKKARFIEQFFRGDPELRTMEDLGEASMYEQASAMSTTDERMITLTDLRQDLDRAMRRESAYDRDQYATRTQVKNYEWWIDHSTKRAAETTQDIAQRIDTRGDAFAMNVAGDDFTTRKEAAEALGKVLEDRVPGMGKDTTQTVGNIGGFPMQVARKGSGRYASTDYELRMSGGQTIALTGSVTEPMSLIQSAEYRLRDLEQRRGEHLQSVEANRDAAAAARKQISTAANPHTEDVARLRKSVADLEAEMRPPTEEELAARRDAAATEAGTQAKFSRDLFGEPRAKDGEPGAAEPDPEMEEAERQLAALQQHLSLEERAEIAGATDAVAKAEQTAAALTEAAACLRGTE